GFFHICVLCRKSTYRSSSSPENMSKPISISAIANLAAPGRLSFAKIRPRCLSPRSPTRQTLLRKTQLDSRHAKRHPLTQKEAIFCAGRLFTRTGTVQTPSRQSTRPPQNPPTTSGPSRPRPVGIPRRRPLPTVLELLRLCASGALWCKMMHNEGDEQFAKTRSPNCIATTEHRQ